MNLAFGNARQDRERSVRHLFVAPSAVRQVSCKRKLKGVVSLIVIVIAAVDEFVSVLRLFAFSE